MSTGIFNSQLVINNIAIAYMPNTLSYTEGFGEANMRTESAGGATTQLIFTRNLETALSSIKFSLSNTPESAELVRVWKINENNNSITLSAKNVGANGAQTFNRNFRECAVTNDPEINLSVDGVIQVEFKGTAAF
jgi:hypothetical protein